MKYEISDSFGAQVHGRTIGEMWAGLVNAVIDNGKKCFDEGRERIALDNIRVKADQQNFPDPIIEHCANGEQLNAMLDLMFTQDVMEDIDVVQSFSPGAKSYSHRIKEGKMVDFVIERLSLIPESKKAVIVFPTYEDYAAVMRNHRDDYLPCVVSIQFRLLPVDQHYLMRTTVYSRSMDVWQKGHGNFLSVAMLSDHIRKEIEKRIDKEIVLGPLDGLICDGHIYNEKYAESRDTMKRLSSMGAEKVAELV